MFPLFFKMWRYCFFIISQAPPYISDQREIIKGNIPYPESEVRELENGGITNHYSVMMIWYESVRFFIWIIHIPFHSFSGIDLILIWFLKKKRWGFLATIWFWFKMGRTLANLPSLRSAALTNPASLAISAVSSSNLASSLLAEVISLLTTSFAYIFLSIVSRLDSCA